MTLDQQDAANDEESRPQWSEESSIFNRDVCKLMISADIPWHKLSNEEFKKFMKKYTGKRLPDSSTIRKLYVGETYKETVKKLQQNAKNKTIWVSLDETTDVEQRYIASFVSGILGEEEEKS